MANLKFLLKRKARARRRRAATPLVPDPLGLSISTTRVNRMVAAVALLGAGATVALAVALTPGGQTSPSRANASQAALAISKIEAPALAQVAEPASPPETIVAALPQGAPKSDRLETARWPMQPAGAEDSNRQPLRGSVRDRAEEPRPVAAPVRRDTRGGLVTLSKPDLRSDLERVSSDPPASAEPDAASVDEATPEPGAAALARTGAGERIEPSGDDLTEARLAAIAEVDQNLRAEPTGDSALQPAEEPAVEVTRDAAGELTDEPAVEVREERAAEPTREARLDPEDEMRPVPVARPEVKFRLAPVTSDVNMRARPQNGSKVIMVVPRRSQVQVIGCDYWCEVIYEGTRGWIYKSFIRRTKS